MNVVLNDKMGVADAFAGHFIKAQGLRAARQWTLCGQDDKDADILVLSAYPKDTEYSQSAPVCCSVGTSQENVLSLTERGHNDCGKWGAEFHALFGPGMSLFSHDDNVPPMELKGKRNKRFILMVLIRLTSEQFYK